MGTVAENIIGLSVLTVDTSKYTVTACRCTETAYTCSEGVLPAYSQNDMIYLCVQPNATVQDTVEVSNFFMEFKQNGRLHGRSLQDTPARAGESFFQMEVQFKKGVAPANDVTLTDSKSGWVLTSVGALIALSAAFLIL